MNQSAETDICTTGEQPRHSPVDDDILIWRHVTNKKLISHELELYATKWFDYRELTPLQATRLYIEAFLTVYRKQMARHMDRDRAQYVTPVSVERIWADMERGVLSPRNRQDFTGCWRGRQCADGIGMPYEAYVENAMRFRLNYWKQRRMPRPTQLYGEMVVEKTAERWEEMQIGRLYLSDRPAYLVQNYAGAQHQDDYHAWLIKQAFLRQDPAMYLGQFVNDDVLPLDVLERHIADHMLERVRSHILH